VFKIFSHYPIIFILSLPPIFSAVHAHWFSPVRYELKFLLSHDFFRLSVPEFKYRNSLKEFNRRLKVDIRKSIADGVIGDVTSRSLSVDVKNDETIYFTWKSNVLLREQELFEKLMQRVEFVLKNMCYDSVKQSADIEQMHAKDALLQTSLLRTITRELIERNDLVLEDPVKLKSEYLQFVEERQGGSLLWLILTESTIESLKIIEKKLDAVSEVVRDRYLDINSDDFTSCNINRSVISKVASVRVDIHRDRDVWFGFAVGVHWSFIFALVLVFIRLFKLGKPT